MSATRVNLNGINELDLTFPGSTSASISSPGVVSVVNTGSGTGPELETNGTPNGSQTLLNLIAGMNVTITDGGTGGVTIASSGGSYSLGGTLSNTNIAVGAGAGAGATVNVIGLDGIHSVELITGTSPTAFPALLFTLTFTTSRGHVTYPVVGLGGNLYSSFAQVPIASGGSATSYICQAGVTPLGASVSYIFTISCP